LSGGLDSSLPAAVAEPPLPAFTINSGTMDYTDSLIVNSDDGPFARQVGVAFGHPHFEVTPPDYATALQRALWANDQIVASEQAVSQNLVAEAAAPHCKARFLRPSGVFCPKLRRPAGVQNPTRRPVSISGRDGRRCTP